MPSFFDLMKYARTGIASPDMTGFDKLRAKAAFGGYPVSTITGVPPISFKADGKPLTAWSIAGNGQQTGTPTPDAPIMPEECGDSTANLFDGQIFITSYPIYATFNDGIVNVTNLVGAMYNPGITVDIEGTTTAFLEPIARDNCSNKGRVSFILDDDTTQEMTVTDENGAIVAASYKTFTKKIKSIRLNWAGVSTSGFAFRLTIVSGATEPASYIPYGYQLPITSNGTTQNAYLTEPIRKIDGYADVLESSGTVIRYVKKLVLTGSEEWNIFTNAGRVSFYTNVADGTTRKIISTHFAKCPENKSFPEPSTILYNGDTNKNMIFRMADDTTITDVDDFKAWVAQRYNNETPVTIWYVLETAQTESFTAPTISTVKGTNSLTVDTTLQPSAVSVTGHIKSS